MKKQLKLFTVVLLMFVTVLLMIPKGYAATKSGDYSYFELEDGSYRKVTNVHIEGTYNYDMAKEAVKEANARRKENGIGELQIDYDLMEYAMKRAAELSVYWSHERPSGETVTYLENIGVATYKMNAKTMTNQWMNSPGHRIQMLTASHNSIGIGCYINEAGIYWIQVFSSKTSANKKTKSGEIKASNTVQVAVDKGYINPYIYGFNDNNTIGIGETLAATKVKNTNAGWNFVYTYIKPSDLTWKSSNTNIFTVDSNGKVTGKNEGTAILTASIGEYSKNFSITVEYKLPFTDVPKGTWYYDAVKYTYKNNIIKGYNKTTFAPFDKLTRGQLVTILWRLEGSPSVSNKNNKFSDVGNNLYYTDAIKWANSKEIVKGYGGTTKFGPDDPIIRQDLAIILNRYAKYKGKNSTQTASLNKFTDYKNVSGYAENAVKWTVANGIITGNSLPNGEKTIAPHANATRAEVVVMLKRYIDKFN